MNTEYILLDLETTGLDPKVDRIVEVGAIALDRQLNEVARFHQVLWTPTAAVETADPVVRKMHTDNGLWAEARDWGLPGDMHTDQLLRAWFDEVQPGGMITLMGNSIHFDQAFLKAHFPEASARLHYRLMDIGGLGRWLRVAGFDVG